MRSAGTSSRLSLQLGSETEFIGMRRAERLESRKLWIDFHGIELTAIPLDPRRMVGEPCVPLGGVGDRLGEQAPDFGRGHPDGDPDAALTFELVRNGR